MSDAIVKNLNFGEDARVKVFKGIQQLTNAVSSTLGAVSYTHLTLPTKRIV